MELLVNVILFSLFVVMQSLFINGVHYAFSKDNLINRINPIFFEKHKKKWWALPVWSCIRCMSSVWGAITFWPPVIDVFGFNVTEIYVFIFDLGILISLNWIVYKKTN